MGERDHDSAGAAGRVVVLMEWQSDGWRLPVFSAVGDRIWIHGGERTMLEIAVAAAASGFDVELRGQFVEREVAGFERAGDVTLERPREERPARAADIVLVPEAHRDPFRYASVAFSPARAVIVLMAAPGLFGWSFDGDAGAGDPLSVDPDSVARPEQLQAARHLGLELWTNLRAIADQARAHDIPHQYLAVGRPRPYPPPPGKTVDVAVLGDNRWSPLAREAIAALRPDVSVATVPALAHDELLLALGAARILVHPARIEGRSRLCEEARAMGTVPVLLASNRMCEGAEAATGGVSVAGVSQMAAAVHDLLDDPGRLGRLAEAGLRDARAAGEWEPFVARVADALATPDVGVARFATARAAVGASLASRERALTDRLGAFEAWVSALETQLGAASEHAAAVSEHAAAASEYAAALQAELERGRLRERELHGALESAYRRYDALRRRKVVRAGLRLAGAREQLRQLRR